MLDIRDGEGGGVLSAGCLVSHHRHHFRSVIVICQEVDSGQWLDDGDNVEVDTGHGNEGGDRVQSTEYMCILELETIIHEV